MEANAPLHRAMAPSAQVLSTLRVRKIKTKLTVIRFLPIFVNFRRAFADFREF